MVVGGVLISKETTSGPGQDEVEMEDDQQDNPPEGEEKKNGTKRQLSPKNEVGQRRCDVLI